MHADLPSDFTGAAMLRNVVPLPAVHDVWYEVQQRYPDLLQVPVCHFQQAEAGGKPHLQTSISS